MSNLSLTYPSGVPLIPQGGRIELNGDVPKNAASRLLQKPLNLALNGEVFYSSALFRRSAVTGELTSVLFERTSDSVIRWYYGIDIDGFFSVAVDPATSTQRATTTFTAEADTTYLVVARMRTNTGTASNDEVFLKIFKEGDVVSEPLTDAGWDLRASGNSGVNLERVRLEMSNAAGQRNEFDEFRIGTSFADVTGIPEPGSAALLAVGALMLGQRQR